MKLTIDHKLPALSQILARSADTLSVSGRRSLFERAAYAVANLVRRHILRIAPAHHISAAKLGAQPTEFFGKAARRTTSSATSDYGLVTIGSAGFSRAFHPVTIRPTRGRRFLTIPKFAQSYGHTVKEMRSHYGWKVYRPGRAKILMGVKDGQRVPLFSLAEQVRQRQDRSLLPSDADIGATAATAAMRELSKQMEPMKA